MSPGKSLTDREHLLRLANQIQDDGNLLSGMSTDDLASLCRELAACVTELSEAPKSAQAKALGNAEKMEALGMFAGGIAHDFNNILGIIANRATLALVEQYSDPEQCEHMKQIIRATDRGKALIKQILTFNRPGPIALTPLALGPILEESASFLSATLPAGIAVRLEHPSSPVLVRGDATQLSQILMNLATNSARAMPGGGTISMRLAQDETKGQALLVVEDTGEGMSAEVLARIFEPYFTTHSGGRGTGLGLAVVHGIIKLHDGSIHCESRMGHGTCFTIGLPLLSEDVELPLPVKAKDASLQCLLHNQQHKARRILFVDDEVELTRSSHKLLESFGHLPLVFTNPAQAILEFTRAPESFDIVITDMLMPDMNGQELAQEILSRNPNTPIILCTGYSEKFSKEQALAMGIRGYVPKPIDWIELDKLIGELTAKSSVSSRP